MLALPAPRTVAPAGLRASLRSAAAMPVEPVDAARATRDAGFGTNVRRIEADRTFEANDGALLRAPTRLNDGVDWVEVRFFGGQSGPFVAQQLGQSGRTVVPTLEPSAEIAAYTAAQQRADDGAAGRTGQLDLQA